MIGPALYLWMLAQHPALPPKIGFHVGSSSGSLAMSLKPDPVVAVTLVSDGEGWIVGAVGKHWSSVGRVSCGDLVLAVSRKVIVRREGMLDLTISLACPMPAVEPAPAEEPKP